MRITANFNSPPLFIERVKTSSVPFLGLFECCSSCKSPLCCPSGLQHHKSCTDLGRIPSQPSSRDTAWCYTGSYICSLGSGSGLENIKKMRTLTGKLQTETFMQHCKKLWDDLSVQSTIKRYVWLKIQLQQKHSSLFILKGSLLKSICWKIQRNIFVWNVTLLSLGWRMKRADKNNQNAFPEAPPWGNFPQVVQTVFSVIPQRLLYSFPFFLRLLCVCIIKLYWTGAIWVMLMMLYISLSARHIPLISLQVFGVGAHTCWTGGCFLFGTGPPLLREKAVQQGGGEVSGPQQV